MRILLLILLILLLWLQYRLWISDEGMREVWSLRQTVVEQQQENIELERRNAVLEAEVRDLRQGHEAVEERARSDLGMVRSDETFVQIIGDDGVGDERAEDDTDGVEAREDP